MVSNTTTLDVQAGTLQFNTSATSANLFTGTGGIVKANSGATVSLLQTNNGGFTSIKDWTLGSKVTLNGGTLSGGSSNGAQFQRLTSVTAIQVDAASVIAQASGGYGQYFVLEGTFTGTGGLTLNRQTPANDSSGSELNLKGNLSGYSGAVTVGGGDTIGTVIFGNATGWGSGSLSLSGTNSRALIGDKAATDFSSSWTGGSALSFTTGTLAATGAITVGPAPCSRSTMRRPMPFWSNPAAG